MELVVFLVSLFGFLALGIPIAIVLVLCSMVLMYYGGMWDSMFVMIIPQSMLDGANNYPLMAIPFFVFAGEIMTEGGLSKRVVKLAQLIIGRVRGGLGYAAIVSSVIFAGLMGSSVGEAAALGSLLLPMMAQAGYKPGRAGGVIASGAILGPIIPPSTNFILLGATVGLSITKLFMIGLVPGLIIGLCLMVTWFFIVRIDGYKEKIEFKKGEASKIVRDAMPAFMMPVLLLGGIRFGVFTPTEGGAFACVYAIAVCTLYYRELTFKGLLAVSARAARTTSVVMLIVATLAAFAFARLSFRGKDLAFTLFLALMMIPNELVIITNFVTVTNLNLRNTFPGLILPSVMSVFYIYLLKENFEQVPEELYKAAKVDGTSDFKYLTKVMIPICSPTMITIVILKVIECWNSYVWPRLITDDENYFLVSNGIQAIRESGFGRENIPAMMAAVVVISVPLIALFLIFRNKIMDGVSRGGTKG